MDLNERQQQLLRTIIRQHIKTAQPVGSKLLSQRSKLGLSPATLRNEMLGLERLGFLVQPFTSAGRIPTEKAYRYYLDHFFSPKKNSKEVKAAIDRIRFEDYSSFQLFIKELAKSLAEISHQMVMLGFSRNDVFYTGISNLFQKKEFHNIDAVYSFSEVVDHLDEVMSKVFDDVSEKIEIAIGSENFFSSVCSSLLTRYHNSYGCGIIGILGPMRMDYEKNFSMLEYVAGKINGVMTK